jgi:hypothetical protein
MPELDETEYTTENDYLTDLTIAGREIIDDKEYYVVTATENYECVSYEDFDNIDTTSNLWNDSESSVRQVITKSYVPIDTYEIERVEFFVKDINPENLIASWEISTEIKKVQFSEVADIFNYDLSYELKNWEEVDTDYDVDKYLQDIDDIINQPADYSDIYQSDIFDVKFEYNSSILGFAYGTATNYCGESIISEKIDFANKPNFRVTVYVCGLGGMAADETISSYTISTASGQLFEVRIERYDTSYRLEAIYDEDIEIYGINPIEVFIQAAASSLEEINTYKQEANSIISSMLINL